MWPVGRVPTGQSLGSSRSSARRSGGSAAIVSVADAATHHNVPVHTDAVHSDAVHTCRSGTSPHGGLLRSHRVGVGSSPPVCMLVRVHGHMRARGCACVRACVRLRVCACL